MKAKILFGILLVFALGSFVSALECYDFDGGLNYGGKGGFNIPGVIVGAEDHCLDSETLVEYFCPADPSKDINYENHICPNGCDDGKCIGEPDTSLPNGNIPSAHGLEIASFGEQTIKTNDYLWFNNVHRRLEVTQYDQCGDIDCSYEIQRKVVRAYNLEEYGYKTGYSEILLGQSTILTIDESPMASAIFSDVGIEVISISGDSAKIKLFNSSSSQEYQDRCLEIGDTGLDYSIKGKVYGYDFSQNEANVLEDYCEGGSLWEYACKEDYQSGNRVNYVYSQVNCPYGCSDGACMNAEQCSSLGFRRNESFCSPEGFFMPQKDDDASCDNNFECKSNLCVSSQCLSATIWNKFLAWLKNLFG